MRERGASLNELLIVVAVAGLSLLATVTYTVPRLDREGLHSAITEVHTYMQLARGEAISRDRACRFVVDTANHRLGVVDTAGTLPFGDDILLYETPLPRNVSFRRPDDGTAIALEPAAGQTFQALFQSDGIVSAGAGELVMQGGSEYARVRVGVNGEIQVHRWDGTAWVPGG
jgi:Tfp pilus assembly protein FimT